MTDLAAASPEEAPKPLARIDVRTLLTGPHLNSSLAAPIEEVISDEHLVESVPRLVADPHRTALLR